MTPRRWSRPERRRMGSAARGRPRRSREWGSGRRRVLLCRSGGGRRWRGEGRIGWADGQGGRRAGMWAHVGGSVETVARLAHAKLLTRAWTDGRGSRAGPGGRDFGCTRDGVNVQLERCRCDGCRTLCACLWPPGPRVGGAWTKRECTVQRTEWVLAVTRGARATKPHLKPSSTDVRISHASAY